jgi:peptidoglycan/xylan/chitin deacetylase (PgdA/CDA1 family)
VTAGTVPAGAWRKPDATFRIVRPLLSIAYRLPAAIPWLGLRLVGSQPSILTYHGIPEISLGSGVYRLDAKAFASQMLHLARFFHFLTLDEFLAGHRATDRKSLLLTFDDGLANNARVAAPILRTLKIPAVFFVSTRHSDPSRPLWPAYLAALQHGFQESSFSFRRELFDMSPVARVASMTRLREVLLALSPHPTAMYEAIDRELPGFGSLLSPSEQLDWTAGMTEEDLRGLDRDPLFDVEAHTVDHPFLTQCEPREARRQVVENKKFVEAACGKRVRALAYPSGDYDERIIDIARSEGFTCGFAVIPVLGTDSKFEFPRAGVFRAAPEVAAFKAMWARRRTGRG